MDKNIIIYRDSLLPISETFIKAQAENLETFTPYYAGYKRVENGLSLPKKFVITSSDKSNKKNTLSEVVMKQMKWNPRLTYKMRQIKPKLLQAHFGPDGVLALPFARKLKVPLVTTFHGYDVTVEDQYLMQQSFNVRHFVKNRNHLINEGARFIAVSNFIHKKLIDRGYPAEKIITHYIGVDCDVLKPDPTISRENVILFVGRLVENKGCEYLIKAFKKISNNNPDTRLVIIGEGPQKSHLETLTKGLNQVEFLGKKPHEDVIQWMKKARIFCVPSIEIDSGASEGFGIVFAEANALGTPVVSFRTGGIPEAVQHGETGLLAEEGDTDLLAEHLQTLLENDNLWQKFSINGRKRVETLFNIKTQTSILEKIYEEIIHDNPYL